MRNVWIVLASALLAFANFVKAQETARNLYSSRYDNLDIDTILASNRLVNNYVDCLLSRKPCPPEGKDLKRILPEALRTKCGRCSVTQKENALKIITTLYYSYPDQYLALRERWDPSGEYHRRFEEYLRGLQFNQIGSNGGGNDRPIPSVGVLSNRFGDDDNEGGNNNGGFQPNPVVTARPTMPPTTRPVVRQTTSRIVAQRTTTRFVAPPPAPTVLQLRPQSVQQIQVQQPQQQQPQQPTVPPQFQAAQPQPPQQQQPQPPPASFQTSAPPVAMTTPNNVIDNFFIPPGQGGAPANNPNASPFVGLFNQIGTKIATTADAIAGMLRKTVDVIVTSHLQSHQRALRSYT